MVLELTDSIRSYSCSFLILLSRLICHTVLDFLFYLQLLCRLHCRLFPFHKNDALRVLARADSSCALLWGIVHISSLITTAVLMTPKCISSALTFILKLQICTDCLFLDIASWITRLLHTHKPGLICPKAKTLAVFLCHLVLSISTQFVEVEAWDAS